MKLKLLKITLTFLIIIGIYWLIKILYIDPDRDFKNPLNPDLIQTQNFNIDAHRDTVLIGQKGTMILINKNIFTDCNGESVAGKVIIKLKEIITKSDMVLSGLSTVSNREMLESGGMIYLNAYQNGKPIYLNNSGSIGVIMKNNSGNSDMRLFKGIVINNSINWVRPEPILSNPDTIISYPENFDYDLDEMTLSQAIEAGLINSDTSIVPNRLVKSKNYDSLYSEYMKDNEINYKLKNELYSIFETQNLGWLNIDRFVEQYRTDKVNFKVTVENGHTFHNIFVKMVFIDLQVILEGYELMDRNFIFGKTGNTEVNLPTGQRACVIVTAFHKRKPYLGLKELTIREDQTVKIDIKETSMEIIKELIYNKF